jgi:hypothetical protein
LALAFTLGFSASFSAPGSQRRTPSNPLYDIVAVGCAQGEILLAVVAAPADKLEWRFRKIAISAPGEAPREIALSASGTKIMVVFADGTPRVFDLTRRIGSIGSGDPAATQHRLPQQLFPYVNQESVCLLNDLGDVQASTCRKAKAAVVNDDGRVLYTLDDGRLIVSTPNSSRQEELPYSLPQNAHFQLLAGHRGAARDFLVLVTESRAGRASEHETRVTKIIDPHTPGTPLAQYRNPNVAALRAQLDFAAATPAEPAPDGPLQITDATLAALAAHLDEEARPARPVWSFYHVAVNTELYAPVLEFAPGEPTYPSDTHIWQEIRPPAEGSSLKAYERAYASLGDRRWASCGSYVRTLSYPGTWLVEYWYYYPFDEGNPHAHFHDSEHIFIEVDKLGGTVRNLFASDHDSFVPNNLYSTLIPEARPVDLPLYAMVELKKHAMAPDLNHDGRFTRGTDDNLHPEAYAFWGLRDRTSKFHFLMEPYRSSMSLPRFRNDRFALWDAAAIFPGIDVPAEHQVCRLRPFPDDPPCPHCDEATTEAAVTHLMDHPDALVPENIYKPYVVPWREVRLGLGLYDWLGDRRSISLTYVGDLRHMTGGLLRAPVRLALDYMWNPFPQPIEVPGPQRIVRCRSSIFAGTHLERLVTNTQGFYFGFTAKWSDILVPSINGASAALDRRWQYAGMAYRAGYILELPSARRGSFVNQVGAVIQGSPYPILFEWRISLGFLRKRGRTDFGGRRGDRNPYEAFASSGK